MTATDHLPEKERIRVQNRLHIGISLGDHALMEAALVEGADPNWLPYPNMHVQQSSTVPLLHFAVRKQDTKAVDILLNWGADAGKSCNLDRTAFQEACYAHSVEVARLFIEAGEDPAQINLRGRNLMCTGDHNAQTRERMQAVLDEYHDLPRVKPSHEPQTLKTRLFRQDAGYRTPLDNPATWRQFDHISDVLIAQGTPITKAEWFELNDTGERWIDVAIKCRSLDKLLHHLQAQGDYLTVREVLDDQPLLEHICAKGGVGHLFTTGQLEKEGMDGLRTLRDHLPENVLAQVPNLTRLSYSLQQDTKVEGQRWGR